MLRERITLGLLLTLTFAIRSIHPDQPIVENYVGRQIPTAMVARNLERGSGFLRPCLDTGPLPNLFLVEPPIYALVVSSVRSNIGFVLEPTGRLVSAAATVLGAWGLFGLARRREGFAVASFCLVAFAAFPVMVRYGRAFQPDALMLGCLLVGLRGWDEFEATGDRRWAVFGGFVLSAALAIKVTSAWALIPFFLIVPRFSTARRVGLSLAMLAPALAWYVHAWSVLGRTSVGSSASWANASIWVGSISPMAWVRFSTWTGLSRDLLLRAFTPVGFVLAAVGLGAAGKVDRLWTGWGIGCVFSVVVLAAKWHHGYYWMAVAPLAAIGVARGFVFFAKRVGQAPASLVALVFLGLCGYQSASTFRTPDEWADLLPAASEFSRMVSEHDESSIAPEALLYYADRKGRRLELNPEAMSRAAAEWLGVLPDDRLPLALVDFYRDGDRLIFPPFEPAVSVIYVADVGLIDHEPRRRMFREALRAAPEATVIVDRPGFLLIRFPQLREPKRVR